MSAWSDLAGRSYGAVRVCDLGITPADRAGLALLNERSQLGLNAISINGIDKGPVWQRVCALPCSEQSCG